MKKSILIVLVLLLLLTGCQTVPASETEPAGSTPSSSSVVPPSSSAVPSTSTPATSIPATSTPITNPPEPDETGYTFIYRGSAPFISIDADYTGCTVGHLYWVDKATEEVTPILEQPTLESIQEGAYVYYVKADEPTKIYCSSFGDFSQHTMIYNCTHGAVSAMLIDTYTIREQLVLQFVADEKKFVVLDLTTGEDHVLMEQYYIRRALFSDSCSDTWAEQNIILFYGRLEKDAPFRPYMCYLETGELREMSEHAD